MQFSANEYMSKGSGGSDGNITTDYNNQIDPPYGISIFRDVWTPDKQLQGSVIHTNPYSQYARESTSTYCDNTEDLRNVEQIYVAFCISTNTKKSTAVKCMIRSIVSCWTQGIHHVELLFAMNGDYRIACTIHYGGRVEMLYRDTLKCYNVEGWETIPVHFNQEQRNQIFAYCWEQIDRPFNTRGLWCNFMPLFRCCMGNDGSKDGSIFCAQLVAESFRLADPRRFGYLQPHLTKPNDLYRIIKELNKNDIHVYSSILTREDMLKTIDV